MREVVRGLKSQKKKRLKSQLKRVWKVKCMGGYVGIYVIRRWVKWESKKSDGVVEKWQQTTSPPIRSSFSILISYSLFFARLSLLLLPSSSSLLLLLIWSFKGCGFSVFWQVYSLDFFYQGNFSSLLYLYASSFLSFPYFASSSSSFTFKRQASYLFYFQIQVLFLFFILKASSSSLVLVDLRSYSSHSNASLEPLVGPWIISSFIFFKVLFLKPIFGLVVLPSLFFFQKILWVFFDSR